jgi:hypothetical protein
MRRIAFVFLILVVAAGLMPAQDQMLLRDSGSLEPGDRRSRDGVYEDRFTVVATEDGSIVVTVVSPDFAPLVVVDVPGRDIRDAGGSEYAVRVPARVSRGDEIEIRVSSTTPVPTDYADYLIAVRYGAAGDMLVLGSTVLGSLSAGDDLDSDGSYIDYYDLELPADVGVQVNLSSYDFDAYLRVELPDGRTLENDDANGTDSSVNIPAGSGGVVRVGATSWGYQSTGEYTIEVISRESTGISVGEYITGNLTGDQATYTLTGTPGDLVAIELRSDDFDTYLELTDAAGTYLYNDDAESFSTSRIIYSISDFGEAEIVVSSFGSSGGEFSLEVYSYTYDGPEIADGYRLQDGDEIRGNLGPHLPMYDGTYQQRFTFEAEAGERVEIVLRSDDFDCYLRVVDPDGFEYTDDDGAGNLDSKLMITADRGGVYEVFARDLGGGSIGDYTLSFSRLNPARVIFSTEGQLTTNSPQDISGKYYETHVFEVEAGANVTIDVVSDDYDGYAVVRTLDGSILYRDDDGGGGGNPRISFTADQTERLELVVTTYSSEVTGRYSVLIYE